MDLSNVGSVALRLMVRSLRNHSQCVTPELLDPSKGATRVANLNSEGCRAAIQASLDAGKISESQVASLAQWAERKAKGKTEEAEKAPESDPTIPPASCAVDGCHHAQIEHSEPSGCLHRNPAGDYDCACSGFKAAPSHVDVAVASETPTVPTNGSVAPALKAALLGLLGDSIQSKATVDEATVRRIVAQAVSEVGALRIEIKAPDGSITPIEGRTHAMFPDLITVLSCDDAAYLVGPAGSSKSHSLSQAAKALGVRYHSQSMSAQTPLSSLFGYMDANGRYVSCPFRDFYENGGLFNWDEIDKGNPNVLAALNSALSNGECGFPDRMVQRHAKFYAGATANTWGLGRDSDYVGSNPIDAATIDRFTQLEWGYDEKLERDLSGNIDWACYVQKWRAALRARTVKHLVTPRASMRGAKYLAAGMASKRVVELVIVRGLPAATRDSILSEVGSFNG